MSEAYDAYLRYDVLAGLIDIEDAADIEEARQDAERYAAYVREDGVYSYLLAVRFMVEVCGVSFNEAWEQVAKSYRDNSDRTERKDVTPEAVALDIFEANKGNILDTLLTARFLKSTFTQEPDYYQAVIDAVRSMRFKR